MGPFTQIVTMDKVRYNGPVTSKDLNIAENKWIAVDRGNIVGIGELLEFRQLFSNDYSIQEMEKPTVLLPGFIDCHTHICYGGNRIDDFSKKLQGIPYLQIAKEGGGIFSTVSATRKSEYSDLLINTKLRARSMMECGITTIEVKSGYGLSVEDEIRMLKVIRQVGEEIDADIISTCLAAHTLPPDFNGNKKEYLDIMAEELLPEIKRQSLSKRVDIFVEDTAFSVDESKSYLHKAKRLGFDLTVHADQFTAGGSTLAVDVNAVSADHLEASGDKEIEILAKSNTVAVVLPGASMGLGIPFAPARKLLDKGCCVAVASDWNPGSAPMGHLLTQLGVLAAYEKLSVAESLASITCRAAKALRLSDRGKIQNGMRADLVGFPSSDYREIIYRQGQLKPSHVWIKGQQI